MLAAWLSFAPTVSTTSVVPLTFDELLAEAATIVRGEVIDVRSDWRDRQPASGPIVTFVTVRVQQRHTGRRLVELEHARGRTPRDRLLPRS
jgi:hypothetical protein